MARISELENLNDDTLELALTPDEYNAMIAADGAIKYKFSLYDHTGNESNRGGVREFSTNASKYRFDADTNEYITIQGVPDKYNFTAIILGKSDRYEGFGLYSDSNGVITPIEGYFIGRSDDVEQYDLTANNGPMAGTTFKYIDETKLSGHGVSYKWDYPRPNKPIKGSPDFYNTGSVLCFAKGVVIDTSAGPVDVAELQIGDLVKTLDHGYQPVEWIGRRKIGKNELENNPKLLPVRITAGALGLNSPLRDLLVSRQHRILCDFGPDSDVKEALIAAIKLTDLPGVYVDDSIEEVEYFHILCDNHEIVFAEGVLAETLFTGAEALKTLSSDALEEVKQILPELGADGYEPEPARPLLTGKMQKNLVEQGLEK